MKEYLPSSLTFGVDSKRLALRERSELKGFTLIELLIVVAIIAVLSVIAIAIFTGAQRQGRDARRRADIDAIASAMEAQKVAGGLNYPVIANNFFSSGLYPNDPTNTLAVGGAATCTPTCKYCFTTAATPITNCPSAAPASGGYIDVTTGTITGWVVSPTWTVCANLENGTSKCRSNAQ